MSRWSDGYTREELEQILFDPCFEGSFTRDLVWINIHKENFARTLYKHLGIDKLMAKFLGKEWSE